MLDAAAATQASGEAAQVRVGRGVAAVVADADVAAVTAVPADPLDDAVAGGEHRRAPRRGEVDAAVHLGITENGVLAQPIARRQTGTVDRRAQQRLAHAVTFLVEVVGPPAARRVAVDAQRAPAQGELGVQQVALAYRRARIVEEALEQHLETVAALNLALEVDVVAEGADHLHQNRHRHAGLVAPPRRGSSRCARARARACVAAAPRPRGRRSRRPRSVQPRRCGPAPPPGPAHATRSGPARPAQARRSP